MFKRVFANFLLCLISVPGFTQELWGTANSNYAGTMGLDLNPASIVGAPFRWELHLLSADVSLMNNYMYLRSNSRAIRSGMKGETLAEDRFTDNFNSRDKNAYGAVYLKLPAFIYSTNKWGIGFHVSTRAAISARGVPYHLAKFMKEGFDYTPLQKTDYKGSGAKAVGFNWHEAGITGGINIRNDKSTTINVGATINYIYGLNSIYMLIDDISYNVQADSLWQIYVASVKYGHAATKGGDNAATDAFKRRGSGFSTTIGLQYYKNRNEAAYNPCLKVSGQKKYDYKIGFSLIDIGRVKFDQQASTYEFSNVSTDWYGIDTVKISSLGNSDTTFGNQFLGSPLAGKTGTAYSLWLPAAASLQIDYAVTPSVYLNFSAVQRLPLSDLAIKRGNQLSLTPRYETKRFEVALPFSYYDYFRPRLGLAIRYSFLTIGTDMIGPFTGLFDAYGLDFYFGIKFQHFGSCDKKKNTRGKVKSSLNCFQKF